MLHNEEKGCDIVKPRTWLIEIRATKGLTQEQVAILSGISRSAYSNVERGKGLSVLLAKKIAKALGFNWQIFFDEKCAEMKQKKPKSA